MNVLLNWYNKYLGCFKHLYLYLKIQYVNLEKKNYLEHKLTELFFKRITTSTRLVNWKKSAKHLFTQINFLHEIQI